MRTLRDYSVQVRLFALLLILFLVILLLGATVLFSRTGSRLEEELDAKLHLVGRIAGERIAADPGWIQGGAGALSPATVAGLSGLLTDAGIQTLRVWDREGKVVAIGVTAAPPAGAALLARAREGEAILSDYVRAASGGYVRLLLLPLGSPPSGVVAVEARADLLGFLDRARWGILGGYGLGVLLAVVMGVLFVRSILRPYQRLSTAAKSATTLEPGAPGPPEGPDMEFVTATRERAVQALQKKEAELCRLYAAEQRRARDLETHQETILGSISSGVISLKPDLTITVCNRTARQIFGIGEEAAVGRSMREVFGPGHEFVRLAEEALAERRTHSRLELSVMDKPGNPVWIGLSSSLLRDDEGQVVGLAFLLTDLTEILQLRQQVMLKESLATVGQMSAGIAHEFRNSLGAILGFAKLVQKRVPAGDPAATHLESIVTEINSLEGTLRDFLAYARPTQLTLTEVDVAALLTDALAGHRVRLEEAGIRTVLDLPAPPLIVMADADALRRAVINLVRNAAEAMREGGTLTLIARVTRGPHDGGPRALEILVQDTGHGIRPEDRERIFTPFYTTREGGTGLGLPLVQKVVVGHGGRIEVESTPGAGATFRIVLPWDERRRRPRI